VQSDRPRSRALLTDDERLTAYPIAVAALGGLLVGAIFLGLPTVINALFFPTDPASTPITTLARANSDSTFIDVSNGPDSDTLFVVLLALDEKGTLFSSRPKAIAPGSRFSVGEKSSVLRGFRTFTANERKPK